MITTIILCSLLTIQCTRDQQVTIDKYFDLQGLISQQVSSLQTHQAQLVKTLKVDESTENQSLTGLDSSQWERELKVFREHDINKPVLIDAYSIKETVSDEGYKLKAYILVEKSLSGVLNIETITDPAGNVTFLKSSFREENILFNNLRNVSMSFHPKSGLISEYTIDGYHKLAFKDTVFYQINAVIEYQN